MTKINMNLLFVCNLLFLVSCQVSKISQAEKERVRNQKEKAINFFNEVDFVGVVVEKNAYQIKLDLSKMIDSIPIEVVNLPRTYNFIALSSDHVYFDLSKECLNEFEIGDSIVKLKGNMNLQNLTKRLNCNIW